MQEFPCIDKNFSISKFVDNLPIRKISHEPNKMAFYVTDVAKMLGVDTRVILRKCEPQHLYSPEMIAEYNIKTYRTDGKFYKKMDLLTEQGLYHVLSATKNHPILEQYHKWDELTKISERVSGSRKITSNEGPDVEKN